MTVSMCPVSRHTPQLIGLPTLSGLIFVRINFRGRRILDISRRFNFADEGFFNILRGFNFADKQIYRISRGFIFAENTKIREIREN